MYVSHFVLLKDFWCFSFRMSVFFIASDLVTFSAYCLKKLKILEFIFSRFTFFTVILLFFTLCFFITVFLSKHCLIEEKKWVRFEFRLDEINNRQLFKTKRSFCFYFCFECVG